MTQRAACAESVGILEAGPLAPHLAERYGSHSDFFRRFLRPQMPAAEFPSYRVYRDELPREPEAHDAWLVTGSSHGVYDDLAWIAPLKAFVRRAAEARPVVGICFGHQLVAEAFGGRVEKARQGWGIGVHSYAVARRESWMQPALASVSLIASHQDQVVTPPAGATVLGGSDFCPIGLLRIADNVLSIQTHPEMPKDYSRDLYDSRRERIGGAAADAAIASLAGPTDEAAVARWIATFITERVAARRAIGRPAAEAARPLI